MSSTLIPALPPGQLSDLMFTGGDPVTADLGGLSSPQAFTSGSAGPASDLANLFALNGAASTPGSATATSGASAPNAPASWWASQPAGVKIAVYAAAVGLILVGVLGLVLPAASRAAPALAAAA
jgi:hypothetical protein